MNTEDFDKSTALPAADIKAVADGADVRVNHSYAVVTPKADRSEFMVTIRASSLKIWRTKLSEIASIQFPWAEVLLAATSVGVGAIASAWISDVKLSEGRGVFFYVVVPPLTAACLVGYLFVRKMIQVSADRIAQSILDDMPPLDELSKDEK